MSVTAITEYPSPAEAAVVRAAEQFMEETMSNFSDPSHDPHHGTVSNAHFMRASQQAHPKLELPTHPVRRVRRTALRLARALSSRPDRTGPTPDLLTVELSALLHDVLDKKYVPPASYAHDARAFFEPFFRSAAALDLRADGRADAIVRIVENVSWSNELRLRASGGWGAWHETCVELHCVQDADRLDAIGAFGELSLRAPHGSLNNPLNVECEKPFPSCRCHALRRI